MSGGDHNQAGVRPAWVVTSSKGGPGTIADLLDQRDALLESFDAVWEATREVERMGYDGQTAVRMVRDALSRGEVSS